MTDDKNEREHCSQVALHLYREIPGLADTAQIVYSERATAFAQGDAQGYERGQTEEREVRLQCEYRNIKAYSDELEKLQSSYNTLAAAARELSEWASQACEHIPGAVECDPSTDDYAVAHQVAEAVKAVRAALGPAPAPEEKS